MLGYEATNYGKSFNDAFTGMGNFMLGKQKQEADLAQRKVENDRADAEAVRSDKRLGSELETAKLQREGIGLENRTKSLDLTIKEDEETDYKAARDQENKRHLDEGARRLAIASSYDGTTPPTDEQIEAAAWINVNSKYVNHDPASTRKDIVAIDTVSEGIDKASSLPKEGFATWGRGDAPPPIQDHMDALSYLLGNTNNNHDRNYVEVAGVQSRPEIGDAEFRLQTKDGLVVKDARQFKEELKAAKVASTLTGMIWEKATPEQKQRMLDAVPKLDEQRITREGYKARIERNAIRQENTNLNQKTLDESLKGATEEDRKRLLPLKSFITSDPTVFNGHIVTTKIAGIETAKSEDGANAQFKAAYDAAAGSKNKRLLAMIGPTMASFKEGKVKGPDALASLKLITAQWKEIEENERKKEELAIKRAAFVHKKDDPQRKAENARLKQYEMDYARAERTKTDETGKPLNQAGIDAIRNRYLSFDKQLKDKYGADHISVSGAIPQSTELPLGAAIEWVKKAKAEDSQRFIPNQKGSFTGKLKKSTGIPLLQDLANFTGVGIRQDDDYKKALIEKGYLPDQAQRIIDLANGKVDQQQYTQGGSTTGITTTTTKPAPDKATQQVLVDKYGSVEKAMEAWNSF